MTKLILIALLMSAWGICTHAQQSAPQKESPKTAKVKTSGWVSSLEKAKKEAETLKQPVFVFCTDELIKSDEVEKRLINSKRFKQFAADNLVMYRLIKDDEKADAKLQKQHKDILKNVRSYVPSFVVVDSTGKMIYKGTKIRELPPDGLFLTELKEVLEKFDYAVNAAALEGYTPPPAATPTKVEPGKKPAPPPKPKKPSPPRRR